MTGIRLREVQFTSYYNGISLVIPLEVQGVKTHAIVDTAAQVSIISEDLTKLINPPLTSVEKVLLRGAGKSSSIIAKKNPNVHLEIGGRRYTWDLLVAPIADSFILGLDFLKTEGGKIDLVDDVVTLKGYKINGKMRKNRDEKYLIQRITLANKVVVPPNSLVQTKVKLESPSGKLYMIHAPERHHKGLVVPYTLVQSGNDPTVTSSQTCKVTICLRNDSNRYIHLNRGHFISRAEEVSEVITEPDPHAPVIEEPERRPLDSSQQTISVNEVIVQNTSLHVRELWENSFKHLNPGQSEVLAKILTNYADVFSKDDMDLGTFSAVQHPIITGNATPIKQKFPSAQY